jgi:hypothetical protein
MATKTKIAGGLALIAAGVATVFVAPSFLTQKLDPAAARQAAELTGKQAATALRAHMESLENTVTEAAGTEPLRAAITNRVDGTTLVDLFATEDWWRARRGTWPLSRVVIGSSVASFGDLQLGDQDRAIVAAARKARVASGFGLVAGRPVQIAAARIDAREEVAPVLVLAKPFNDTLLAAMADQSHLALAIVNGGHVLESAGSSDQRAALEELARAADGKEVSRPDLGWVAASQELGTGLRLWAIRALPGGGGGGGKVPVPVWILAAVLAIGGATLMLVGRAPGDGTRAVRTTRTGAAHGAPTEVLHEETIPFGSTTSRRARARLAGDAQNGGDPSVIDDEKTDAHTLSPLAAPPPHKLTPISTALGTPSEKPRTFGRYRLLDLLGVGGMSEVYTAVAHGAEGFRRTFVVKRLRPELARDREAVSQFIDEARIQSCLLHTNIVPVFDFGTMGDEYFMAQEYVIGRDLMRLSTRCIEKTNFCLDPRIVYYIIHETLQALAYAHGKKDKAGAAMGIVHRDVSASNIMMTAAGDVRLFDFGIAKTHGGQRTVQTQAGLVKGNANFMSPEQARGQAVDGRSDLFSLGMVLYYCLTGCLFYNGDNDLDVLYRAACGPSEQDLASLDQLPGPAGPILRRALAFKPDDRYQSAEEFATALAPYAIGMKPEAAKLMEQLFGTELNKEAAA